MIACGVRVWFAATRPLWHDEIFTLWLSRSDLGAILSALRLPLFLLAARDDEASARDDADR